MAILQVLANLDNPDAPKLLLGVEEPELFQHPFQLRHLAQTFINLSERNSQVILCTHSPHFVFGSRISEIRLFTKYSGNTKVASTDLGRVSDLLIQSGSEAANEAPSRLELMMHDALHPEQNEMFFSRIPILVEGQSDRAAIITYMMLMEKWSEFRALGCDIIVCNMKSKMIRPLGTLLSLDRTSFVVFDADSYETDQEKRTNQAARNRQLLNLLGFRDQVDFPEQDILALSSAFIWRDCLESQLFAAQQNENWIRAKDVVRRRFNSPRDVDKSSLFIANSLSVAWESDLKSANLTYLCERLLAFARAN